MRALLDEVVATLRKSARLDADVRDDAPREARLIAAAILECAPGDIARRMAHPVERGDEERIRAAAIRRAHDEPLAYCVGSAPFRHLVLRVDARVLIPRPETEIVVGEALKLSAATPGGIAVDIGTGSGAIALALATEGRFERVIATDVSVDALDVARDNASRLPAGAAPVEFRGGADFAPVKGVRARVIVSNPPYISFREAQALPASVRDWEPAVALFASDGGMARYVALLAGAADCLEPGGWLVLETDAGRAFHTHTLAMAAGFTDVRLVQDLSGRARVMVARSQM
ncbi:MAG: peptide chain release factor N(5)-glutamine methyltransferase [Gemmatimonas sp.]